MAKNKKGQTVKNKKYYKNKNNPNKKKNNKPKNKKFENNVSIIVDDKKEALNYNIVDSNEEEKSVEKEAFEEVIRVKYEPTVEQEEIITVKYEPKEEQEEIIRVKYEPKEEKATEKDKEEDQVAKEVRELVEEETNKLINNEVHEEFDFRAKRVKSNRKVKTNFKEEVHEEKFVFSDELPISKKNKKNKEKNKPVEEKVETNVEEQNVDLGLVDDSVELPIKIDKETYEKEVKNQDKDIVDKAFENTDQDVGDIDKPAIFRNIQVDDGSFRRFVIKLFVLLVILILSIFFVIDFSVKYMNSTTTKDVGYFESSDIDYSLCNKGNCVTNNLIDKSINTVNIKFDYDLSFDEKINFDGKYNVVAKFSINDNKTGDVLYTENKDIKKDTFNKKNIQNFEIKEDAILLLDDYRKYLSKYNKDRNSNYVGEVRVNLYVDGVNGKKRVSSLLVPLQDRQQVEKTIISYQAGDASIEDDGTYYGKVYVYLIIISLMLVIGSSIGVVLLLSGADEEDE